jgi:hypothetical protein
VADVFDDKLENTWKDQSTCSVSYHSTTTKHSGTYGISTSCKGHAAFFMGTKEPVKITPNTALQFWINAGTNTNIPLRVGINPQATPAGRIVSECQSDCCQGSQYLLSHWFSNRVVPSNTWVKVTVPLSTVYTPASNGKTVTQFWLQNNNADPISTFFLDDINFVQLPVGKCHIL